MSLDTSSAPPGVRAPLAHEGRNATVIVAIVGHHAGLAEQLRLLTEALLAAVSAGTYVAERGHLLDWYSGELMPHVEAEEKALYGIGADLEPTRLLVLGMVAEHRYLAALIGELEEARGPIEVVAAAAAAHELFRAHLGKESDLLLPGLDATGMDLGVALDGMPKIHGAWTVLADQGELGCGCGAGTADAGAATTFDISPAARPGELDMRALPKAAATTSSAPPSTVSGRGSPS